MNIDKNATLSTFGDSSIVPDTSATQAGSLPLPGKAIRTGEDFSSVKSKDAPNGFTAAPGGSESESERSTNIQKAGKLAPIVYTRKDLLSLSSSPLVAPPYGLPLLKDWFGEWTEQSAPNYKKDVDLLPHVKDRRFKRDGDDTETGGSRPSFRSAVGSTQPSQMGNFKHQSSRVSSISERERLDRESDRDRDGNERLRNLSEKYDRDRLALTSTGLRRDAARTGINSGTVGSGTKHDRKERDKDNTDREGGRKRVEMKEDWRSGNRDDREQHRDRSRDSGGDRGRDEWYTERRHGGRQRGDTSADGWETAPRQSHSPRDDLFEAGGEVQRDHDIPRDRGSRREHRGRNPELGDKRGTRRLASEADNDETRSWKDDGRWEERQSARDTKDRHRPRQGERENGNAKSGGGRSKRNHADEDREPAWMSSYDPETDGKLSGILGGQASNGKLDDIQAWKKELKEKEMKEQGVSGDAQGENSNDAVVAVQKPPEPKPVDEISMFKMMMQREQSKDDLEGPPSQAIDGQSIASSSKPQPMMNSILDSNQLSIAASTLNLGMCRPQSAVGQSHMKASARTGESANLSPTLLPTANSAALAGAVSNVSNPQNLPTVADSTNPTAFGNAPTSYRGDYDPPRQSRFLAFAKADTASGSMPKLQTPMEVTLDSQNEPRAREFLPNIMMAEHSSSYGHVKGGNDFLGQSANLMTRVTPDPISREGIGHLMRNDRLDGREGHISGLRLSPAIPNPSTPAIGEVTPSIPSNPSLRGSSRFAKFFDTKPRDVGPSTSEGALNNLSGISFNSQESSRPSSRPLASHSALEGNTTGQAVAADGDAFQSVLSMLHNSSKNVLSPDSLSGASAHPRQQSLANPPRSIQGEVTTLPHNLPANPRLPQHGLYSQPTVTAFDREKQFELNQGGRPPRSRDLATDMFFEEGMGDQGVYLSNRNGLPQQQLPFEMNPSLASHLHRPPSGGSRGNPQHYNPGFSMASGNMNQYSQIQPPPPSQRLPPGLANLGSRPPHDPSQFGAGLGIGTSGISPHLPHGFGGDLPSYAKFSNQFPGRGGQFPHTQNIFASGSPSTLAPQSFLEERNMYGRVEREVPSHIATQSNRMSSTDAVMAQQHELLRAQQLQQLQLQQQQQQQQQQQSHLVSHHRGLQKPSQPMSYPLGARPIMEPQQANNDLMALLMRGGARQ